MIHDVIERFRYRFRVASESDASIPLAYVSAFFYASKGNEKVMWKVKMTRTIALIIAINHIPGEA